MSSLKFAGKTEPPAAEGNAELRRAIDENRMVFAVIDTEKGRTLYTNVGGAEEIEALFAWLLSGVLEGIRDELLQEDAAASEIQ
jgi:hypothetical protein